MTRKISLNPVLAIFTETFGLGRVVAASAVGLISLVILLAVFWFFHSAPPKTLSITGGPEGSLFQTNAEKYRAILARNGVKLKILPSQGSLENLQRLTDEAVRVDIGFVQGGVTNGTNLDGLVSLGSISYEPLMIFCRSEKPVELLSELNGKRLAIGPVGSGTRTLALTLLQTNGVDLGAGSTLGLDPAGAAAALLEGKLDAVFLMGDSASSQLMRKMLRTPNIQLLDFTQAEAYARRFGYLNKLVLPKGSIDFGKNIPNHDVQLIGPTVELLARANLHPALSDLLLEAAREVHGGASLLKRKGEFPAPLEHDFPISPDAARYYKSGKTFLYRYLPYWLASLVNRILVIFVPMVVVLIPGLRLIPWLYRWRMKLRLFRWYRALLVLDRDLFGPLTTQKREELLGRLDQVEAAVNKMKVPASFADQFYGLRGHISFVRNRLLEEAQRP
jgi:TRAP-type uncharacterized transport system substrate-binding protein